MVTGWRRAFCTSITKDRDSKVLIEKQQQHHNNGNQQSPRINSKFGFFSNPSTTRLQSQSQAQSVVSSPGLRCRTTATNTPTSSLPNSPKLQCNVSSAATTPKKASSYSPRLLFHFQRSNPSSPKSPSSFSLLKSTLRLSKMRNLLTECEKRSGHRHFYSGVLPFLPLRLHLRPRQEEQPPPVPRLQYRLEGAAVNLRPQTTNPTQTAANFIAQEAQRHRREKNAVASIMLLSDAEQPEANQKRSSPVVSSTRLPHLDIPVHTVALGDGCDDALAKCVGGLLSVVVQDLSLQLGVVSGSSPAEIAAVYSLTGRPAALGSGSIRLGDLYAGEERELLVELKVAVSATGGPHSSQNVMSVRSTHRDPSSNELVYSKERGLLVPRSQTVRSSSSNPNIERLRNLHVAARAVAESRRFVERSSDFSGAYHLLSSARTLLVQSSSASAEEFLRGLEGEMAELQRRRQIQLLAEVEAKQSKKGCSNGQAEEKQEPLTPTSAWRAAEKLAKVATMRKSMNRVSDLHGFENARF
ncbi:hypothetical protein C1H46_009827 [Malus baccata]|uniref:E3 ubiquitin-protein ligase WAV3-like C-terminal domain-containing protein n=1 Tax=Malus baccata TaxID=106549 RepID=A0A540N1W6_MALBA|nr:hypothetical protein C1H46_009827 [Malus baccata]